MKKRVFYIILALVMVISIIPVAFAQEGEPFSGEGTQNAPYEISNVADLQALADAVNNGTDYSDKYFKLTADINLSGVEWTPIGRFLGKDSSTCFSGTFDGGRHTISGLTITKTYEGATNYSYDAYGLFGAVGNGATISNLTMESPTITLDQAKNVGALVGGVAYNATRTEVKITNVVVNNATVQANGRVGGIIGWVIDSVKGVELNNCTVSGDISAVYNESKDDDGDKAGGLVGHAQSKLTIVGSSYTNGTVSAYREAGGIAGRYDNDDVAMTILSCTVADATIQQDKTNGDHDDPRCGQLIGRIDDSSINAGGNDFSENVTVLADNAPADGFGETSSGTVTKYVARIGSTGYTDLATALTEAKSGDVVDLLADVEVSSVVQDSAVPNQNPALKITTGITLNGNGHRIKAGTFTMDETGKAINSLLDIQSVTDTVTINDLTIVGNETNKHGINVYQSQNVVLNNVTSEKNGSTGLTINQSKVTATNFNASGNRSRWYSVDVGNGSDSSSFILNSGNIEGGLFGLRAQSGASVTVYNGYVSMLSGTSVTVEGGSFGVSVAQYVADSLHYEANTNGVYTYHKTLNDALATGGMVQSVDTAKKPTSEKHTLKVENNGTAIATVVLAEDESYTLPAAPERGAYWYFLGWSDGSKIYQPGDDVTISGDTTFTALWQYIPPADPSYQITIPATANGAVTVSPTSAKEDQVVTITITPDEGFALASLAVTDFFGNQVDISRNSDGTYSFVMPASQVTVSAVFVPAQLPFTDVTEANWYYDEVYYVWANGLMQGTSATTFGPNVDTTRAMVVTILWRLEGEPASGYDMDYSDVAGGAWYADAVRWATEHGIVNGSEGQFYPGGTVTREQLAAMLYRYAQYKGYDLTAGGDLSGFADAGAVSGWAETSLAWAVGQGLLQGSDSQVDPQGSAIRAQTAAILMRFCENMLE